MVKNDQRETAGAGARAAVSKEWYGGIRAFQAEEELPLQEQRAGVWPSYDPTWHLAAPPCCLPQRAVPPPCRAP